MHTIAFLGGSFDPIHHGHLWMADAVSTQISCTLKLMPTPRSPIKQTATSTKHRVAMLKQVCRDQRYQIEYRELKGPSPASSIDTFTQLRKHYGKRVVFIFIIGQDNFETLHEWKGGFDLLQLTHLWVFPRPQNTTPSEPLVVASAHQEAQIHDIARLQNQAHGLIYLDSRIPPSISSTQIRTQLSAYKHLVPPRVFAYSKRANLYRSSAI